MNKKIIFFSIILFLAFFAGAKNARAMDVTATSCSAADITSAITLCLSTGGGTVTLPECDYTSATPNGALWTSNTQKVVAYNIGSTTLRVVGKGSNSTKIGYSTMSAGPHMWKFIGAGLKQFSGMTLHGTGYPYTGYPAFSISGAVDCLVNDIKTDNWSGPTAMICATSNLVVANSVFETIMTGGMYQFYVYGDCTTTNPEPYYADKIDWTSRYGTNQYDVFFENNTFYDAHHPIALFTGATVVVRYNNFFPRGLGGNYQDNLDSHGPTYGDCDSFLENESPNPCNWDCDPRYGWTQHGGRGYEIYNNIFHSSPVASWTPLRLRSGFTIFYNNSVENYVRSVILTLDGNTLDGSLCTSGNGWPQDHKFTAYCGVGDGCCDKPENIWIWGNSINSSCTASKTPWDCCTGSGTGSCVSNVLVETAGVSYTAAAPTLGTDGFNWTPYTYPHPLRNEGTSDTTPPAAPTGVTVQ